MKANELMIGDFVFHEKYGNAIIETIDNGFGDEPSVKLISENIKHKDGYKYGYCWRDLNEIFPIPLTPEILEKNGWYHGKFDGSYGRKAMRLDGPYKDKLPDGVDNALSFAQWSIDEKFEYHLLNVYLWKGSVRLWIEYVHELQHVFKLCRIEKEIKL